MSYYFVDADVTVETVGNKYIYVHERQPQNVNFIVTREREAQSDFL